MILCILLLLRVEKSHLSPFSYLELALQERTHCPEARSVMIQKPVVIHFFRTCPGFQVKITLLFSQTPASGHASQVADISSSQQSPQKVTVQGSGSGIFSFPSKIGFLKWVVFCRVFIGLRGFVSSNSAY